MSIQQFLVAVKAEKLSEGDAKWFPRWVDREGHGSRIASRATLRCRDELTRRTDVLPLGFIEASPVEDARWVVARQMAAPLGL